MDSHRRQLLIAAGTALAAPLVRAQQSQKVRRIGFLAHSPISAGVQKWWRARLQTAGYEDGKNLVVEWRSAEGDAGRLPALADELVRLKVELIFAVTGEALEAARHASQSIPIVMAFASFPIERGLIKSFARPAGNVTGTVVSTDPEEPILKLFQIYRDALPKASRVTSLWNDADPTMRFFDLQSVHRRARELGFNVQEIPITRPDEVKPALQRVASSRPDVFYVSGGLTSFGVLNEIAAFALREKLVTVSDSNIYVAVGGLLSYGPNQESVADLACSYVDKILRGAKPADLPVQQTTKWDLVLNTKTAQAIGFKPPSAFMLQVTRQIG